MITLENDKSQILSLRRQVHYKLIQIRRFHLLVTEEEYGHFKLVGETYRIYSAQMLKHEIKKIVPINRVMQLFETIDTILENMDDILKQLDVLQVIEKTSRVDPETFRSFHRDNINLLINLRYELSCLLSWREVIDDFFNLYPELVDYGYFDLKYLRDFYTKATPIFKTLEERLPKDLQEFDHINDTDSVIENKDNKENMTTYDSLELLELVKKELCIGGHYRFEIFPEWTKLRKWLTKLYPTRRIFTRKSHYYLLDDLIKLLEQMENIQLSQNEPDMTNLDDIFADKPDDNDNDNNDDNYLFENDNDNDDEIIVLEKRTKNIIKI